MSAVSDRLSRRLLLVAVTVLAIALVPGVVATAAVATPAVATPAIDTPAAAQQDPCADRPGTGSAVVVTPSTDEPIGPNGTASVYRGSELVVHLCQPGGGAHSLDASNHDWAAALDAGEDRAERLRIRVDGPTNDSLGVLASPGSVPGPSLRIVDLAVETALANRSIPVGSAEQRAALREAEATYLEQERALEAQLASLAGATDAVANGSAPAGDPITETMAARRAYRNATGELRAELYAIADSSVGGPRSAAAIRTLGDRSSALENGTRQRLRAHDDALRERQRSLTWSLRLRTFGIGLLGVLLGGLVGAILPLRRSRAARRRLAAGEWTTYSKRALLLPVAIGLALLCLGAGWLVLEAGAAIAEVTLP